jgi:hypothetical protein
MSAEITPANSTLHPIFMKLFFYLIVLTCLCISCKTKSSAKTEHFKTIVTDTMKLMPYNEIDISRIRTIANSQMKSGKSFKISLEEMSFKGKKIIAQQSEISFAKALAQIQLLKKNSKVAQLSKSISGI